MALDIGPKSIELFEGEIADARTVVWNGPMGVFEMPAFAHGTMSIAQAVADNEDCTSIVGGGDSVAAVAQSGVASRITHISTGGGGASARIPGRQEAAGRGSADGQVNFKRTLGRIKTMRKPLIAANWKMYKTPAEADAFLAA